MLSYAYAAEILRAYIFLLASESVCVCVSFHSVCICKIIMAGVIRLTGWLVGWKRSSGCAHTKARALARVCFACYVVGLRNCSLHFFFMLCVCVFLLVKL